MHDINFTNYHIEELKNSENLSERTKNVCLKGSLDNLNKILIYFLKNGNFKKIRNCGDKTNKELINMAEKYLARFKFTIDDLEISDESEVFERFKFFCYESFGIPSVETEVFREEFFKNKFPFFRYVMLILKKILNEREYFIFKHNYGYLFEQEKMTLQSIGDIYGITRERIRQISQMIPYKLEEAVIRLTKEQDYIKSCFHYNLDIKADYILIDNNTAREINKLEDLKFTVKFYALVFSILYSKTYSMFQDKEITYKNYFLVKNDLFKQFRFAALFDDLVEKTNQRIEVSYAEDFDKVLKKYLKSDDPAIFKRIKPMCRHILKIGLNLEVNKENMLFIPRNTMVKLSEYIVDIVKNAGRPMHLKEIHKELSRRSHKAPHNIESLRSSILSIDDIVAIGKTSTYALKQWGNIKTGTIKTLVKEYLSQFDEPRHINDIAEYVIQFRKTTDKNILSNLKLDRTRAFVFYKKSFIGLRSKKYKRIGGKHSQLRLL
ncbi:MAG: hypothetical protein NT175_01635 [Bacteroidetes bacterium]|nr:hypothetical protein [Bacteroidota bacterium]